MYTWEVNKATFSFVRVVSKQACKWILFLCLFFCFNYNCLVFISTPAKETHVNYNVNNNIHLFYFPSFMMHKVILKSVVFHNVGMK